MSINIPNEFLSKKRDDNLLKEKEFGSGDFNSSSQHFPNPNSLLGLQKKESSYYGNNTFSYNMMTPTYDIHQNPFHNSSNAIITPTSPGYNMQSSTQFYNYKSNYTPVNTLVNKTPGPSTHGMIIPSSDTNYSATDLSNSSKKDFSSTAIDTINIPEGSAPKLQNIVSTVNLKCPLELRDIALKAKNAEYNPKRFAAVIMRIKEPKTTALIFGSGKMVVTGARSEEDSRKACRNFAKHIHKLGYPVKFAEFKIQNIVGSCDVRFPIRLEGLATTHSKFCSYEPEMFPGLIYKMAMPKIVLLIFVSGKIVLTGAKERNDIFEAYEKIYPVLLGFRKKENPVVQSED